MSVKKDFQKIGKTTYAKNAEVKKTTIRNKLKQNKNESANGSV